MYHREWSCGLLCLVCVCVCVGGGGRGRELLLINDSWVGMYCWYPETLSSAEFCYPILDQETTEVDTLFDIKPSYREINFIFWVSSPSFPSVESNLQAVDQFVENDTLFETQSLSFHTLSQSKLLENHTLHTVAYIALKMAVHYPLAIVLPLTLVTFRALTYKFVPGPARENYGSSFLFYCIYFLTFMK